MRVYLAVLLVGLLAVAEGQQTAAPTATPLVLGKRALAAKQFPEAKSIFAKYGRDHVDDVQGMLGLAEAELGLREYEAAELDFRRVAAKQPQMWEAHKNLVIVEAALGRWDEFDREREVLRAARLRGAAGLSMRDSDVIDVLMVRRIKGGAEERWIVRDYLQPAGRAQTRYNFERFSPEGKVLEYVSLESADAFREQSKADSVLVGPVVKDAGTARGFALDWYDGKSHGLIKAYAQEPKYEDVRRAFLHWVKVRRA